MPAHLSIRISGYLAKNVILGNSFLKIHVLEENFREVVRLTTHYGRKHYILCLSLLYVEQIVFSGLIWATWCLCLAPYTARFK